LRKCADTNISVTILDYGCAIWHEVVAIASEEREIGYLIVIL